jgi:ATP-binding cassette subfamily F protein 3
LELTSDGINEYLGNYDEYIERKNQLAQTEPEKEKSAPKKVNEYLLRKERASQLRKAKTRLARVEGEIEEAEALIDEINEKLTGSD